MKTERSSIQVRRVLTYVRVRDKLRNQPRLKDRQAHRNSKGSKQPKARKTGPPPHYVYRRMPQEPAVMTYSQSYRQSPGSARKGTVSQPSHPSRQASTAGRSKHTSQGGISEGANPDVKTTKRTAIARGHSNRKRGRQGHRHTMSIAGCSRSRLS